MDVDYKELSEEFGIDWKDYYNPCKILGEKDQDGDEPGIVIVCGNRSAGKTTGFLLCALMLWCKYKMKFILIYRYSYEIGSANEIFYDILAQYPIFGKEMTTKPQAKGLFYNILLDGISCGFSISLNNVDGLKKYSPIFKDCYFCVMDEMSTESGKYLTKELDKLQSILISVSRGGGKQSKEMKLCLLSNRISLVNPYFIGFGIYKKIKKDTKILHGSGYVAEFNYTESSSNAINENKLLKAFKESNYLKSMTSDIYLLDDSIFIQKPTGKSKYIFTFIFNGEKFGVWNYFEENYIYVTTKINNDFPIVIALKPSDHNQNTLMLNKYDYLFQNIKNAYEKGFLRFNDLKAKNAIIEILGIDLYK